MRQAGIQAVLLNTGIKNLKELRPVARKQELEVHLWKPTLMQAGPLEQQPEWYAVNRQGKSTAEKPPYVPLSLPLSITAAGQGVPGGRRLPYSPDRTEIGPAGLDPMGPGCRFAHDLPQLL